MNLLRRIFLSLVFLLAVLTVLATLLSLIYDVQFWFLKILDFPRLQLLLVSLLLMVLIMILQKEWNTRAWILIISLAGSAFIQAYFIFPYTSVAREEVKGTKESEVERNRRVRLMLANVYMKNRNHEELRKLIEEVNPDMVLLVEVNEWWVKSLDPLIASYPYRVIYPLENTYGMILLSRFSLKDTEINFLNHEDVPSIYTKVKMDKGKTFNFHGVHPVPPIPDQYPDNIGEEEVALLKIGQRVSEEQGPSLVAGDFNDVSWSNTSRMFEEEGKLGNVRLGRGLYNTFNAKSPILRWPLDHVFVSEEFTLVKMKRLREIGSDHFPLYVELAL